MPEILLDPEGIHCCLLNLVSNAFDACMDVEHAGGAKEVVIRTARAEGGGVEYGVIDSGCGMDEDVKDKIFRSFFSTKGTRGTGLGLMITQKVVREHGGDIKVESEKGSGTRFAIKLPAHPGIRDNSLSERTAPPGPASQAGGVSRSRIGSAALNPQSKFIDERKSHG